MDSLKNLPTPNEWLKIKKRKFYGDLYSKFRYYDLPRVFLRFIQFEIDHFFCLACINL